MLLSFTYVLPLASTIVAVADVSSVTVTSNLVTVLPPTLTRTCTEAPSVDLIPVIVPFASTVTEFSSSDMYSTVSVVSYFTKLPSSSVLVTSKKPAIVAVPPTDTVILASVPSTLQSFVSANLPALPSRPAQYASASSTSITSSSLKISFLILSENDLYSSEYSAPFPEL